MPESKKTANLSYALNLKPDKALEYFKSKGYAVPESLSENYEAIWQEAHAKAFTVARATRLDILKDIREELDKSLSEGKTFKQFQKELEPKLRAKGWWGWTKDENDNNVQLGSVRRLKTIFDTNINTAYQAGRYKEMSENVNNRPNWMYDAVGDSRTRPAHAALNGKIFRYDDPFWDTHYPPNGYNCRCSVRALNENDIKNRGLSVSSAEGQLSTDMVQISGKNKELTPVTTYTDPTTGEKTSTDIGWNYNVGKTAWQPDLEKYDYKTAKQYTQGIATGPPFELFHKQAQEKAAWALKETFEKGLKQDKLNKNAVDYLYKNLPKDEKLIFNYVAILDAEKKKLLGAKKQAVKFSLENMAKNIISHKEISLADYALIPEIVDKTEVLIYIPENAAQKEKIYCFADKGKYYAAIIKSTGIKDENFLQSLHFTDLKRLKAVKKKKGNKVIYDTLTQ